MKATVITTAPGVIMATATASVNCCSDNQWKSWTTPWYRNGTTASPLPKTNAPAFVKNSRMSSNTVWLDILLFFTKAGAFVFGSGLAVVPFLYQGVVQDFHWLSEQQFTDAVAVAMITPGPVVITVAFIGYLVAGLPGASLAAIGIFLPVFVPVVVVSPWFKRHRDNARLQAFVQGATAAATGAI